MKNIDHWDYIEWQVKQTPVANLTVNLANTTIWFDHVGVAIEYIEASREVPVKLGTCLVVTKLDWSAKNKSPMFFKLSYLDQIIIGFRFRRLKKWCRTQIANSKKQQLYDAESATYTTIDQYNKKEWSTLYEK